MEFKAYITCVAILLLVISGCASTSPGQRAYQSGDYTKALTLLEDEAGRGQSYSATMLGLMYERGHGVAKDISKAKIWHQKAAEGGDVSGQLNYARMLIQGPEQERDYAKAASYYEIGANKGVREARYQLGLLYVEGRGVPKDLSRGVELLLKAAKAAPAQSTPIFQPGFDGKGVQYVTSITTPGAPGHLKAQEALGRLYNDDKLSGSLAERARIYAHYDLSPKVYSESEIAQMFINKTHHSPLMYRNLIVYTAADGGIFLWFPNDKRVSRGKWRINGQTSICMRYDRTDLGSDQVSAKDKFVCNPIKMWKMSLEEVVSGDVFNLETRTEVPWVVTEKEKFSIRSAQ